MCIRLRLRYIMSRYRGVLSEKRAESWEEGERAEEGQGKWRSRGEQSMAKGKEKMAEAREVEKKKRRIHQCSSVLIAVKSGTRLKVVMRRWRFKPDMWRLWKSRWQVLHIPLPVGKTVVQLRHPKLGKASRETVSSGGGQLKTVSSTSSFLGHHRSQASLI